MAAGKLDNLKNGPLYWVDSADSQPCIGTAGAITWHLKALGRLFHSGLPHKAINPIELGFETLNIIQRAWAVCVPSMSCVACCSACDWVCRVCRQVLLGVPSAREGSRVQVCHAIHDEAHACHHPQGRPEPGACMLLLLCV